MKQIQYFASGLVLILSLFCSNAYKRGAPAGNFLRPSDDYASLQFRPVPQLNTVSQAFIVRNLNDAFVWELPSAVEGELRFSLLVEFGEIPSQVEFTVRDGNQVLLHEDLSREHFWRDSGEARFSLWREYKFSGAFAHKSRLIFSVASSSKRASDTFGLGDLRLNTVSVQKPVNVLLLSIDTLRADYLGVYRRRLNLETDRSSFSPNIDRLAEESALFTSAYTTHPSTWAALSSLFLSRLPFQHGVVDNGMLLHGNPQSLATILFGHHFQTASLLANAYSLNIPGFSTTMNFFNQDESLANHAAELIAANRGQRFFFWFHFMGVHAAYTPPASLLAEIERRPFAQPFPANEDELGKISRGERPDTPETIQYVRDCYAGELRQLDNWLERIFSALRRGGLWDRTLIVLLSDHGEDLYDHNRHFFHHPSIYRSSLNIPLIIKFPGSAYRGVYSSDASIMDVAPTLLEALGIRQRLSAEEGGSLLPVLRGEVRREENGGQQKLVISETTGSLIFSAIRGPWQLIFNPKGLTPLTQSGDPYPIQRLELYNMAEDRGEASNLSVRKARVAFEMSEQLLAFLKSREFSWQKRKIDLKKVPTQAQTELKSLGYL